MDDVLMSTLLTPILLLVPQKRCCVLLLQPDQRGAGTLDRTRPQHNLQGTSGRKVKGMVLMPIETVKNNLTDGVNRAKRGLKRLLEHSK